jgi:acetyl esterase
MNCSEIKRFWARQEVLLTREVQKAADTPDEPVLEPAIQQFLDGVGESRAPPIYTLSPAEARQALAVLQSGSVGKPAARLDDMVFPVGPTGSVRVRIIRPQGKNGGLPVVLYLPGGGWISGDKNTHDRLIRQIAVGARAAVFFVEYDRAPEAKYPIALEQIYAVTRYVVTHGVNLGVDSTRMAIMGDGAGGNMAAAVTLMARERRGPKIDLQVLFYPVVDASFNTRSYMSFADGPWLTRRAMEGFWNAYLPDVLARQQITATPLNASIDQLTGLPDAFIIVAENDVLRDEGESYARNLSRAGVRVTSTRYNGTIHDFVMLNALADTPAACSAIAQAIAALQSVLE